MQKNGRTQPQSDTKKTAMMEVIAEDRGRNGRMPRGCRRVERQPGLDEPLENEYFE